VNTIPKIEDDEQNQHQDAQRNSEKKLHTIGIATGGIQEEAVFELVA